MQIVHHSIKQSLPAILVVQHPIVQFCTYRPLRLVIARYPEGSSAKYTTIFMNQFTATNVFDTTILEESGKILSRDIWIYTTDETSQLLWNCLD